MDIERTSLEIEWLEHFYSPTGLPEYGQAGGRTSGIKQHHPPRRKSRSRLHAPPPALARYRKRKQ